MSSPLVSVVISAYNRPSLLREGLCSVTRQSYQNLDILVQDDSTNDECGQVVRSLDDSRIRYLRNQPSLGTLANLRSGYRRATGKYLCTLNDDDLYLPSYVEKMVQMMEAHPECCLAFSDHFIIDAEGQVDLAQTEINTRRFRRDQLVPGILESSLRVALVDKSVPGMFTLYRRELIDFDDFPDEVNSGYDYWLIYLATRSNRPMVYTSERLTCYRVHEASQTSSFSNAEQRLRSLAYDLFMTKRMVADPRVESIHAALRQRVAKIYTSLGRTWMQLGRRWDAFGHFVAALRTEPAPDAAAGLVLSLAPSAFANRIIGLRKRSALEMR